jgi:predicted P-loop ATPase
MNFELYNSINKIELWMEIYNLYKSNYKFELDKKDINTLEELTTRYVAINSERELIQQYVILPKPGEDFKEMTATEIKMYIDNESQQKININKLGSELQYMKFERCNRRVNGKNSQLYRVKLKGLRALTNLDYKS